MVTMTKALKEKFAGVLIANGAQIGGMCRIDAGCEISAESVIQQQVAICKNVQIIGAVKIDYGVVIRENVTLVGPLHICQNSFIGHDSILGATREELVTAQKETVIGERCRIGKEVEILGGVQMGNYVRVRAGSRVMGDVPQYGVVSRSPAILERFGCPGCGGRLNISANHGGAIFVKCAHCDQGEIKFSTREWSDSPNHVLLPDGALGIEFVPTLGDDLRWLEDWETR